MNSQKKLRTGRRTHGSRSKAGAGERAYGPALLPKRSIHESMGRELGRRPMGLVRRRWEQGREQEGRETYFDLTLRVGELNFIKRFRNLHYLDSFAPKKNMQHICEEKAVSQAYRQLAQLAQQRRLLHSRAGSSDS